MAPSGSPWNWNRNGKEQRRLYGFPMRWWREPPGGRRNSAAFCVSGGLYINLLEINDLRKHTVIFGENRHRTSIFYCKFCAKTGIRSGAKSDSGAKFSLKITGRFSFMFQQPFRRETEIENFSNHKHTEASAKAIFWNRKSRKKTEDPADADAQRSI